MQSLEAFLRDQGHVPPRFLPHYLRWIEAYRAYEARFGAQPPPGPATATRFARFLEHLAGEHEDWQVRQARHAVRLFLYFARGRPAEATFLPPASSPAAAASGPAAAAAPPAGQAPHAAAPVHDWEAAEETMIRLMRLKHLAYRTEQAYVGWVRRFRSRMGGRLPDSLGPGDLRDFLSYLAVDREVAAATQKQAFNALLFLYRKVLGVEITGLDTVIPSRTPRRLPLVLTPREIRQVFAQLSGTPLLIVQLIYGGGLRLAECLSLRVKDADFGRGCLVIRAGKGEKDRETLLSDKTAEALRAHLRGVRALFASDRRRGIAGVSLPDALACKYRNAGLEWG